AVRQCVLAALGARVRPAAVAAVGLLPGGHFRFSRFHAKRSCCVYTDSTRRPVSCLPRRSACVDSTRRSPHRGKRHGVSRATLSLDPGNGLWTHELTPRTEQHDGWLPGSTPGVRAAAVRLRPCTPRIRPAELRTSGASPGGSCSK
ncbi:hypothetical protein E2I00_008756, partial [Balaenoptera physalus]